MPQLNTILRFIALFIAVPVCFAVTASPFSPAMTYFKEINASHGLPDNRVNAICEDKFGFIWIGTWNGLACYDGNTIRSYRHYDDDPESLCNNMVRGLYAAKEGIWIATDNGVDFFSFADGKFCHGKVTGAKVAGIQELSARICRVTGISGGPVFCVTIGGELLKLQQDTDGSLNHGIRNPIFRILPKPENRRYGDITIFADDKLMALSNEGITVLSPDGEQELIHNNIPLGYDTNMNIYCDNRDSKVYVGKGLGSWSRTYRIMNATGKLKHDPALPSVQGLMAATRCGDKVYLACDGTGLHAIDGNGNIEHYGNDNSTFKADVFYTVCDDSRGNLWCGSYRNGVGMLSPSLNRFNIFNKSSGLSHDIVTASVRDGNTLYLGLDGGGLDVFDTATGRHDNYNMSNSGIPGNNVVSLVKENDKLYMAVYSSGLAVFDIKNHTFSMHKIPDENFQRLWVLHRDKIGKLWIGGEGLHIMNLSTGEITTLDGCNNLAVMSIKERGNLIYVATRLEGVIVIDKTSLAVKARYSDRPTADIHLPSRNADFLSVDSRGLIWVTLASKGLFSIDPRSEKVCSYNEHQGLTEPRVQSMIEDEHGCIWTGTVNGLYKYVRKWDMFLRYGDERLLTSYCSNAADISDGMIYLGTGKGLVSIPVNRPEVINVPREVIFTDLQIMLSPKKHRTLFTRGERRVTLTHDENFFIANFTVPEMVNAEQLLFEYRLDGLEEIWRTDAGLRAATYTNISPGDYTLLVRHSLPDGSMTEPARLIIQILPPWYLTWWAWFLWLVLIAGALFSAYTIWRRFYENKEKARLAELKNEADRKLNEMRLDFYVKFTHELRTPCFLISAQMEEMLESENPYVPVGHLRGPYRNSIKLTRIINRIIDFRKMDSGSFRLEPRKIEVCAFFGDLVPDYEQLCHHKGLSFNYVHDMPPIEAVFDPDKIELVVTNLISNAFKYTHRGGSVILQIRNSDDNIIISVTDTGIGIVESNREAIFQPYFRSERGQKEWRGDGIGLSFVKELVEMHGGHIELQSEVNVGSTFTVIIPKLLIPAQQLPDPIDRADIISNKTPELIPGNPTATRAMLIVDDDPEVINLLARTFSDNYRIEYASDGIDGLEKARTGEYDIVITDLLMPGLDGHALISALKSDPQTRNIKIVVFSSLASESDYIKAYSAKVDAFITKPSSLKILRVSVDRLFEKSVDSEMNFSTVKPITETYTREEQRFISKCRRIIDETMCDDNFGIELIASRLSMSHSSLYKKIRKLTGLSLVEFINEYRIYKAVQLFRNGSSNVQEVAAKCGFRDIKTFRETFKRKMNMPPKQYISQITQRN